MKCFLISLISLIACNLMSYEVFNQVSTKVAPIEVDSSYLKLEHESHFQIQNDERIVFHLGQELHFKYIKNEVGLVYRKFFHRWGAGLNFFYMNTNEPSFFIHQVSPGLELFYEKFQASYNCYIPTTGQKSYRNKIFSHNPVSEFGLNYRFSKWFNAGAHPIYDHKDKNWGLNSHATFLIKDLYEVSVGPYFKKANNGVTLSFGYKFGGKRSSESEKVQRSNPFSYSVTKKEPKVYAVVAEKQVPFVQEKVDPLTLFQESDPIIPEIIEEEIEKEVSVIPEVVEKDEVKESSTVIEPEDAPVTPPPTPKQWWNIFPLFKWNDKKDEMTVKNGFEFQFASPSFALESSKPSSASDSDSSERDSPPPSPQMSPYQDPSLSEWVIIETK